MAPTPTLGRYRIVDRIAADAFVETYRGRLDGIAGFHRMFTIQRLHPGVAKLPGLLTALEEDVRRAALLTHGNLTQVLDLGRDRGTVHVVAEDVDGTDLSVLLARLRDRRERLPLSLAVHIAIEVLSGLVYAHGRTEGDELQLGPRSGVLHGDVHSSHVKIGRRGEVKLGGFGLGRARRAATAAGRGPVLRLAEATAPERLGGAPTTARTDVFLVGVVLYEAITGDHPFRRSGRLEGQQAESVRAALSDGHVPSLRARRADAPDALAALVHETLSQDPAARPASAAVLRDRLAALVEAGTVERAGTSELGAYVQPRLGDATSATEPAQLLAWLDAVADDTGGPPEPTQPAPFDDDDDDDATPPTPIAPP
ncbi:MAG: hypothetical protein RLZZ383_337, partial [Pseudomonadota bacterium]